MAVVPADILGAVAITEWRSTRRVADLLPERHRIGHVWRALCRLEAEGKIERRGRWPMWRKRAARRD
jgi:hypothetical protein